MSPKPAIRTCHVALATAALLAAGGCTSSPGPAAGGGVGASTANAATGSASGTLSSRSDQAPVTRGTAASGTTTEAPTAGPADLLGGLDVPWAIGLLPDGSSLVSVRNTGEVWHVPKPGTGGQAAVAGTLPIARSGGEGGLLGLAVPEDFEANPVFYAYYSTGNDNRIAAVPWRDGTLGEPQVIFNGIPQGRNHNGGRIAFGPDGYLYVGTGEAGDTALAQNLGSLGGKILRITPEGKPAPGNPFGASPIWSYGHRNVQGLAWDSSKRLWASEFGANTWDELNLIEPGDNYGWPEVEGKAGNPAYVDPVAQWPTADLSPSGITVGPDGAVYIAALRGQSVWRVPIAADGTAGTPTRHLEGTYGRLRDIRFVDDRVWVLTSNGADDRLVSLPPGDVGAT
ncbi:MAG: PQQ-dependent sugar dehydrogenase [Humibacillus sp.]